MAKTTAKVGKKKAAAPTPSTPAPTATTIAPPSAPTAKPKPENFGEFMAKLARATDPAKLDKATAMLRAERFKLFAKVDSDHLLL